jgi:hypothetical protein
MSADLPEFKRMAVTGAPPYDLSSEDGGDNREGVLGQQRATSIVARGNKKKVREVGGKRSM